MTMFIFWFLLMITIYFASFREDFNEEDFGKASLFYGVYLAVVTVGLIASIVLEVFK